MISIRVLLLVLVVVIAGCSNDADGDEGVLTIDATRPNDALDFSMTADAIDATLGGVDGEETPTLGPTVIIVPTDNALLSLDADSLASIVAGGGLTSLVEQSVVRAGYERPAQDGDVLILANGDAVRVTERAGQTLLNEMPLVEVTSFDGIDVLVVDGLVVAP